MDHYNFISTSACNRTIHFVEMSHNSLRARSMTVRRRTTIQCKPLKLATILGIKSSGRKSSQQFKTENPRSCCLHIYVVLVFNGHIPNPAPLMYEKVSAITSDGEPCTPPTSRLQPQTKPPTYRTRYVNQVIP